MAVEISFQPPKINPVAALAAVKSGAEQAAAEHILAVSQPLVPVESGDLKASGHVETDGHGAAIIYDAVAPDDYAYGIKQHEDLTLNHPNGGQAKFLEQPLNSEQQAVAAILAAAYARVL